MYWVSAGFTGFYWIFIGSNQVKLGFPGFDRTVQGFLFKSWSDFSLTSVHPLKKKKISAVGRRELGEKKEKKKRRKEKKKKRKKEEKKKRKKEKKKKKKKKEKKKKKMKKRKKKK